jgi:hypothetical protein
MSPEKREQLCALSYSDLEQLAGRLDDLCTIVRNPGIVKDLHQAALAASDLASTRFAIEEIATACDDTMVAIELCALLGKDKN